MRPPFALTLINRELGILEFNARVLAHHAARDLPLLERLRYVCIVSGNLDEFFEVRVAGLREKLRDNPAAVSSDGMLVREVYRAVAERACELVQQQYTALTQDILPKLAERGVVFHAADDWNAVQREWAARYFHRELTPILTPITLDPAHPFPRVSNKSLNFIVQLGGRDAFGRAVRLGIVQAPRTLARVVRMPTELSGHPYGLVLLSAFMEAFVSSLFPGIEVLGCYQFRVTRNAELFVSEDEATDLREALQGELPERHHGAAVRLEIARGAPPPLVDRLLREFDLGADDCYRVDGPVNLVRLLTVPDMIDEPDMKFDPFVPNIPAEMAGESVFRTLRKRDVLLHHPYESFAPVLEFLQEAGRDPAVLAIKMTIYRTGSESAVMEALIDAARHGKEVTAVVELFARFDEETNIDWSARLAAAGVQVVYGVMGHKCHAKMTLIVRRENDALGTPYLRRYVHLGTGNYHARTARLYTDFGLLTSQEEIGEDVHHLFQLLTGAGDPPKLHHLWHAPFTLHDKLIEKIQAEAEQARQGRPARIIAKMNALLEPTVIAALYDASCAGVRIDLIVRGVCALRPGVPGLSEHITVRSIIGRFLEHHRVFYFHAAGQDQVYLSSADWMDRNLFRRVEIAFPVLDRRLRDRVLREGLRLPLRDNSNAWLMQSDGQYELRRSRAKQRLSSQGALLAHFRQGRAGAGKVPLLPLDPRLRKRQE
ncbi:polyphosphate kinase 1 [Chitinasiproducens palmae]|nr:polyphosphate kinase 1 [Chitinasiproducens palmae]